jgi:hypothetical protein
MSPLQGLVSCTDIGWMAYFVLNLQGALKDAHFGLLAVQRRPMLSTSLNMKHMQ